MKLESPLRYDPGLVEEAVFLAAEGHPEAKKFHRERDRIYGIKHPEERERAFDDLHRGWFLRLGLADQIEKAISEQPLLSSNAKGCLVARAPGKREEGAELFVNPVPQTYVRGFGPEPQADEWQRIGSKVKKWFGIGALPLGEVQNIHPVSTVVDRERIVFSWQSWNGVHPRTHMRGVLWYGVNPEEKLSDKERRTVSIFLRAESLLDPSALRTFLRHELMHIADMLDPGFGYEPELPPAEGGPTHDRLLKERYRVLWDATIDGRMVRRGWAPDSLRAERLNEFCRTFPMFGQKSESLFSRFFDREPHTHAELVAFILDPRAIIGAPEAPHPGSRCPLCGFPTYDFEPAPEHLSPELLDQITRDSPRWRPTHGLCRQCADLYRSHEISTRTVNPFDTPPTGRGLLRVDGEQHTNNLTPCTGHESNRQKSTRDTCMTLQSHLSSSNK